MKQLLVYLLLIFAFSTGMADEIEFSFDADEVDGSTEAEPAQSDDTGEMSFGLDEVQKDANQAQQEAAADQQLIRVLQRRPFLRKKRYELSPEIGMLVNDSLVDAVSFGGRFAYHLSEVIAISLGGAATLSSETDLFEKVIEDYAVFPEVSKLLWRTSADFQYAFLYGKFALFNTWIISWDTVASLGAGAVQSELAIHPAFTAGLSQRFFMTRWFTLNLGAKDFLYLEDYSSGGELINHLIVTAGVSFFFPMNFTYRTLR